MKTVHIVKIGSDSITEKNLEKLLQDIVKYEYQNQERFLIISSGAVKLGEEQVKKSGCIGDFSSASLASLGQQYLMQMYNRKLSGNRLLGQVLLDDSVNHEYIQSLIKDTQLNKEEIREILRLVNEKKDRHLAKTIANLVRNDVLVIVNHNDTTSENELKNMTARTDNDKNTIYISEIIEQYSAEIQLKVGKVIYLTNTDGVLDNDGNTLSGGSFSQDDFETEKVKYLAYVNTEKSKAGTGGMVSKINCAFESLRLGVEQSIISSAEKGLDCLKSDTSSCTKFSIEKKLEIIK